MPTGAELFVDSAQQLGIDTIYTLVGDHLNEVLAVAGQRGMQIVDMRHESGVTHAADAHARLTRKPSLSLVTGGPGHTNSLTGIATANASCSPLIAVSGAPARAMRHRVVFQDLDQLSMAAPACKWSGQPTDVGQIPLFLGRAYTEAISGRMGATHLTIPVDLFAGKTESPLALPKYAGQTNQGPHPKDVEQALALLRTAKRPVVIAGSGVWWADAGKELYAFLQKTKLPYYSVTMARGVISDHYKYAMGFADPALNKSIHTLFKEADVVLVLGKRIDYRLAMGGPRLFAPDAKFIQVDIHPQELGANRDLAVGICADVKATLEAFNAALEQERWKTLPWIMRLRAGQREWHDALYRLAEDHAGDKQLHPATFFAELGRSMPMTPLYCWDGGDFIHWGRAMLPATKPGGWLRLGPMGTIGSALPNAIAMQRLRPEEPVVVVTGDGSLGFYIAEMDTLVRYNLPVVIVVGNDGGWGLERELQNALLDTGETYACELRRTRYDLVMKGFGGGGESVDTVAEIEPAVKRAFSSGKPYVLNVNILGARSPFTDWQVAGKASAKK